MCGIAALVGPGSRASHASPSGLAAFGHTRMSIIGLASASGTLVEWVP